MSRRAVFTPTVWQIILFILLCSFTPWTAHAAGSNEIARNSNSPGTRPEAVFIGNLPGVTVMADFIRYRGRLLMAATDAKKIRIYEVSEKTAPVAAGDPPFLGQIIALKWWQPEIDGSLYLTSVTWSDNAVWGTIWVMRDNRLIAVKERIPSILGAFDRDGDQRPETLMAQEFDPEFFFGWRVKELQLINGRIVYLPPPRPLPARFPVLGSLFADLQGDGRLETVFIRDGVLNIYAGKKKIYASSRQMGGSLSFLTYDVNPTAKSVMPTSAAFEISPVAGDIDGDGQRELLAATSEKTWVGGFGISPGIKNSRLATVRFENGRFSTTAFSPEMTAAVQGLALSKHRVLLVVSEVGSDFGAGGSSQLLAYPLTPPSVP